MKLLFTLLASFLIGKVSSEVQCPDLTNSSMKELDTFSSIILGRTCTSTTSGDVNTVDHVLWTVTSTNLSDTVQVNMSPAGVVVPYVEDDTLKFYFGQDIKGSEAGVEIIIPSGKVSTIQIADNNAIAYLTFSESMNIDIESNSVDLFITNSNALTIQGKLNNLELMINASSTTFNDLSFNYMTAEIKGSTSGSIQGNWADLLIEGTLESLYAALNMLEVTINGEGCENINFEGNRKTCKRTNTTVTVPLTICTEPTFMVTHSCNGYYYYHHGSWDD